MKYGATIKTSKILGAMAGIALSLGTEAAEFTFLADPSLIERSPGPDGLWDTGDEFGGRGINAPGTVSGGFYNTGRLGNFGTISFYGGTFSTDTPTGVLRTGSIPITALNLTGRVVSPSFGFNFTADEIIGNTQVNADHTLSSSFSQRVRTSVSNDRQSFTSLGGFYLLRGQDPAATFADMNIVKHFNFVIPLLPSDWSTVGVERFSFSTISGTNRGSNGFASNTFFTAGGAQVEIGDVSVTDFGIPGESFHLIGNTAAGSVEVFNGFSTASIFSALVGANTTGSGSIIVRDNSTLDAGSFVAISTNPSLNDFGQDPTDAIPDVAPGIGTVTLKNGGHIVTDLGVFIGDGGTLNGNGTVTGGVTVGEGGVLAPGLSPGTLNIEGDLTLLPGSSVVLELAGTTSGLFDVLNVTGNFVAGGTLQIELIDGFTPNPTDVFDFLNADSFEGSFANIISPTFGNGQTLRVNFGPNGATLSAVPLPAAVWLLGSAFGGLCVMRRRG